MATVSYVCKVILHVKQEKLNSSAESEKDCCSSVTAVMPQEIDFSASLINLVKTEQGHVQPPDTNMLYVGCDIHDLHLI